MNRISILCKIPVTNRIKTLSYTGKDTDALTLYTTLIVVSLLTKTRQYVFANITLKIICMTAEIIPML